MMIIPREDKLVRMYIQVTEVDEQGNAVSGTPPPQLPPTEERWKNEEKEEKKKKRKEKEERKRKRRKEKKRKKRKRKRRKGKEKKKKRRKCKDKQHPANTPLDRPLQGQPRVAPRGRQPHPLALQALVQALPLVHGLPHRPALREQLRLARPRLPRRRRRPYAQPQGWPRHEHLHGRYRTPLFSPQPNPRPNYN